MNEITKNVIDEPMNKLTKGEADEPMNKRKEEFINSLLNGGMVDAVYGYAYKRCFSKDEAEELCQEIITEILFALTNNGDVSNLNAYIWRIANNTYVNHVSRNKCRQNSFHSFDDMLPNANAVYTDSMEDDIIERIFDRERLALIKREIASLSEIYRDIMIMHYLEELPISVIANRLDIPPNRVKQRLYTAREKIRKEVLGMKTAKQEAAMNTAKQKADMNTVKQEVDMNTTNQATSTKLYDLMLAFWSGDLFKYDPRDKISSSLLKKNIIIACRNKAKSIQELSGEFGVPLAIMTDEVMNIPDDFLKEVSGGKYIANSIVVEIELQEKLDALTAEITADYFKDVKKYLLSKKDEIMALPFINPPKNFNYLLWWYLPLFADSVKQAVSRKIEKKIEDKKIKSEERKVEIICTMTDPDNKDTVVKGKNHNGIWNVFNMLGQHEEVRIENISIPKYLPWEKGRFYAGQDFNSFPELAMVFKTIDGLDAASVAEADKEAAAKALEKGYIRKENGILYPDVPIAPQSTFNHLTLGKYGDVKHIFGVNEMALHKNSEIFKAADKYADKIADKLWDYANKHLPPHLLYLSGVFASSLLHMGYYLLEEGVKDGILHELPENGCTEGIMASVYYPQLRVEFGDIIEIYNNEEAVREGFLSEYKVTNVTEGRNGIGEKIGLQAGDVLTAVNGVDWVAYWKNKKWSASRGNYWQEGDVITINRNGSKVNLIVAF